MEDLILNYVKPELLVLIPILYLIGLALKKASFIKDKFIPLILGILGVVLVFVYLISIKGWRTELIGMSIVQGVLVAAGAVYGNNIIKQLIKRE